MRVSVIMGIYNCEETLDEAILSIVNQSYNDWELIMCDDGSIDNTYNIACKYKELYSDKIILLKNSCNKGLSYTLNQCLKYARGEYIARMDGDDLSEYNRLEVEVDFLDKYKEYAVVSCASIHFDGKEEIVNCKIEGSPSIDVFPKGTPFCHPACMVRKEAYDAIKGYDESKNKIRVEDFDLWVRMYELGYRGYNLSTPLYRFRDDLNAYKRRKYKYRINEALVSISAVKKLHLSKYLYIYALRPIIVGLLPRRLYMYLHKKRLKIKK